MNSQSKESRTTDEKSPWNSLEIAKLLVSMVTPLILVWVGYIITNIQTEVTRSREDRLRTETQMIDAQKQATETQRVERQRIREFRLEIYKEVGPLLNDILAYHFYVGRWKEFTPQIIVEKKRKLDSLMYSHESLFTPGYFAKYINFMAQSFQAAGGWGTDSKLRTQAKCQSKNRIKSTRIGPLDSHRRITVAEYV